MNQKEQEAYNHLHDIFKRYQAKYGYLVNCDYFNFGGGVYDDDYSTNLANEMVINRQHATTGNIIFYVSCKIVYRGSGAGIFADTYSYRLTVGRHEDRKVKEFKSEEKLLAEFDRVFNLEYRRVMNAKKRKLAQIIDNLPG